MKNSPWYQLPLASWGKSMRERTDAELQQQKREAYGKYMNMVLEFRGSSVLCLCSGLRLYFPPSLCIQILLILKAQLRGFSHTKPSLVSLQLEVIFHSSAPFLLCNRNFSAFFSGTSHLLPYVTIKQLVVCTSESTSERAGVLSHHLCSITTTLLTVGTRSKLADWIISQLRWDAGPHLWEVLRDPQAAGCALTTMFSIQRYCDWNVPLDLWSILFMQRHDKNRAHPSFSWSRSFCLCCVFPNLAA